MAPHLPAPSQDDTRAATSGTASRPARRTGRRPGDNRTRERIAAVASRQFAEQGFDRVSLRSVAAEAEVDPALVARFYGTKHQLFAAVVKLPFDPERVVHHITAGDPAGIGERLATFVLGVLSSPQGAETMTGLIRSAASEPDAARMVRELVLGEVLDRVAADLDVDQPQLRSALAASQVVGMVFARHVVGLPALVEQGPADLIAVLAPTLQRYLTEPLLGAGGPPC